MFEVKCKLYIKEMNFKFMYKFLIVVGDMLKFCGYFFEGFDLNNFWVDFKWFL